MGDDLIFLMVFGGVLMIFIPLGIIYGFIKPQGVIAKKSKPSKRELIIVLVALFFGATIVGVAMSEFSSTILLTGMGIFLSSVVAILSRKWKHII